MNEFEEFLAEIDNPEHRARTEEVLTWVAEKYPPFERAIKWNQPMFIDHGTYIIGFSVSKQHLAASPEQAGIIHFSEQIVQAGYKHTKMLVQFPWNRPVDYDLLEKMIEYNVEDKADITTFWR